MRAASRRRRPRQRKHARSALLGSEPARRRSRKPPLRASRIGTIMGSARLTPTRRRHVRSLGRSARTRAFSAAERGSAPPRSLIPGQRPFRSYPAKRDRAGNGTRALAHRVPVIAALDDPLRAGAAGNDADVMAPHHHDADGPAAHCGRPRPSFGPARDCGWRCRDDGRATTHTTRAADRPRGRRVHAPGVRHACRGGARDGSRDARASRDEPMGDVCVDAHWRRLERRRSRRRTGDTQTGNPA